jgi:cystathionine gamma-synthase
MTLKVKVISQQPPGGRCNLYAGYAEALAHHFRTSADIEYSAVRGAHGDGFPSLWLNGVAIQPEDGAIIMPSDILATLSAQGVPSDSMTGLGEALEAPLEHILGNAG